MVENQLIVHEGLGLAQQPGGITGSGVAPGPTEHDHQPIPPVRTSSECREVQSHGMPAGNNPV